MLLHKQEFASCGNSVHKFRMLMQELLPWLCISFQDLQCEMSVHASTCAFCMLTAHGRTSIGSLFTLQFYLLTIQVSEVDARSIVTINFSNLQCEHMLQDDASASSDTKWYKNTHNKHIHTHTHTQLLVCNPVFLWPCWLQLHTWHSRHCLHHNVPPVLHREWISAEICRGSHLPGCSTGDQWCISYEWPISYVSATDSLIPIRKILQTSLRKRLQCLKLTYLATTPLHHAYVHTTTHTHTHTHTHKTYTCTHRL